MDDFFMFIYRNVDFTTISLGVTDGGGDVGSQGGLGL